MEKPTVNVWRGPLIYRFSALSFKSLKNRTLSFKLNSMSTTISRDIDFLLFSPNSLLNLAYKIDYSLRK